MIKIAACFKISDDIDELTPSDWEMKDERGRPKTDIVRRILGCFDEAVLENALLLKEQIQRCGIEVNLQAVTLNPGYSEHIMNRLKALGFDEIICIEAETSVDFDPKETSRILNENIDRDTDVIICGIQCAPGNTGEVPMFISKLRGYRFFNAVTKIDIADNMPYVVCEYKKEYIRYEMTEKCVLSLYNTEKSFLRIPTLREKMKAKEFSLIIKKIPAESNDDDLSFEYNPNERRALIKSLDDDQVKNIHLLIKDFKE